MLHVQQIEQAGQAAVEPLRLLAELHGHLGWLAAAALVHPAILLSNPKRKAGLAVALASGLVSAGALSGALLYGTYRERIKPVLFAVSPTVGWMFERKEHLAFGAAALAWAGVALESRYEVVSEYINQVSNVLFGAFVIYLGYRYVKVFRNRRRSRA